MKTPEQVDEATLIEERRKRREAIKAKYRGQATPLLVQALQLENNPVPESPSTPMTDETQPQRSQSGRYHFCGGVRIKLSPRCRVSPTI